MKTIYRSYLGHAASNSDCSIEGVIYTNEEEWKKIKGRKIFLAQETSIKDMPMIVKADAVITMQGGILSHAAIVCRELNIPCIVGVKGIEGKVSALEHVELDFEKGSVRTYNK